MPTVDIDRASALDKIHSKRMSHAFAQLCLDLIRLEEPRVNAILAHKGIAVFPGPVVGIEYGPGDRQILDAERAQANAEAEAVAKARAPKPAKKKAKR